MTYTFFFFFNDTATTEIYTLSLHDALPISTNSCLVTVHPPSSRFARAKLTAIPDNVRSRTAFLCGFFPERDRKSTRLNSSHDQISYAVFCLKKKKNTAPN